MRIMSVVREKQAEIGKGESTDCAEKRRPLSRTTSIQLEGVIGIPIQ